MINRRALFGGLAASPLVVAQVAVAKELPKLDVLPTPTSLSPLEWAQTVNENMRQMQAALRELMQRP